MIRVELVCFTKSIPRRSGAGEWFSVLLKGFLSPRRLLWQNEMKTTQNVYIKSSLLEVHVSDSSTVQSVPPFPSPTQFRLVLRPTLLSGVNK